MRGEILYCFFFFFSSRRRHTRWPRDWSSDVCSSDLADRGDVAEGEGRIEKLRRLADGCKGQFVARHAVITQSITATHDRLLVAENIVGESEHRPELHAAAFDAAREVTVFAADHAVERIA